MLQSHGPLERPTPPSSGPETGPGPCAPAPARAARRPSAGVPLLIASGLLWGTGGLTGALLSRTTGLSALAVAGYRLAAGGVLIVAVLLLTGRRPPTGRAPWRRVLAVGALAVIFQGSYFTAVALTSVSLATLVTIGASPVIVLAVERLTGRRRGDRSAVAAAGLALAGLALLVGAPVAGRGAVTVLGAAAALLAAAGFAAVTLLGAAPVPGLDDLTATGYAFSAGGLVLLSLAGALGGIGFRPHPAALGLLLALGTGPTALAYTLYFRGLRTAPAGTGALLALLEPLTGTVLAALLLGDRLGRSGIAGALLLVAAVALAASRRGR